MQDQEYVQKGKETMEQTWELMSLNDGWKSEKVKDGVVVESRKIRSGKKIYRLKVMSIEVCRSSVVDSEIHIL